MHLKDINNLHDIQLLVNSFYDRVKIDPLLGPIFHGIIRDQWPAHLDKMYRFWETVLLDAHTYQGAPFLPHASMPLEQQHFHRWISLFHGTIDEHFSGEKAERAKWQASKMASLFLNKIQSYQNKPSKPLL